MHIAGDNFPDTTSEQSVAVSWPSIKMQKSLWHLCFIVSISLDAENMAKEGYQSMLQNLISKILKDGRMCLVKQGELFILSLLQGCPKSIGI